MIIHSTYTPSRHVNLQQRVLNTLLDIVRPLAGRTLPPPAEWPSTRQIADAHDISIYKARLLLLALERQGLVIGSRTVISKSLRWYPVAQRQPH